MTDYIVIYSDSSDPEALAQKSIFIPGQIEPKSCLLDVLNQAKNRTHILKSSCQSLEGGFIQHLCCRLIGFSVLGIILVYWGASY